MSIVARWKDEWVVIGGGSRGLGLAIARRLSMHGAKLVLIGRNPESLIESQKALLALGAGEVQVFAMDLTRIPTVQDSEAARFRAFCDSHSIRLCIAAVGKSDRGYLHSIQPIEIQEAIATNVISSLQLAQWTSSALRKANGSLVFIASIAGLAVAPGMGAYSVSKAALVALARQFRRENQDIATTIVCTGPIQREDAGQRYDQLTSERDLPGHLNSPGGGVRIKALDPDRLAERILVATAKSKKELILPWKVRLLLAISAFFPSLADKLILNSFRKR